MKYMGSKRWQLRNGLGKQLRKVVRPDDKFVDLFSGAGSVSWFAATELRAEVTAVDLQAYSAVIAGAVIERTDAVDAERLVREWLLPVRLAAVDPVEAIVYERDVMSGELSQMAVESLRERAAGEPGIFIRSYSGHYFSIEQGWCLDELRATLPKDAVDAQVCLAALITAASRCSASPGHTAQPFQPTRNALPHIESIWRRSLLDEVEEALRAFCSRHASVRGQALVGDAIDHARTLKGGEVVFLDPPYSAVQYSRFYHVLEAVAVGGFDEVSGAGRSPALSSRRRSDFSMVSSAERALFELLEVLGEAGCKVVLTFPQGRASNGVTGGELVKMAKRWFDVDSAVSVATFSTLGGNGEGRSARHRTNELVATMFPRS